MKQFLINIAIFIVLFFIFDRMFLILRNYSPTIQKDKRLELVLNGKMNKDIVIFGSSRGARDVLACSIQDLLGKSCYNLSYPGSNIEFHEFLLRTLIEFNKKPKIVLLVLDDSSEFLKSNLTDRKDVLYPLIKYKYIRNELVRKKVKNPLLSDIFILHQLNKANFKLKKQKFTALDSIDICGSMPISFQRERRNAKWNYGENNFYKIEDEVNIYKECFSRFQKICEDKGIKLILVFPPNFSNLNNYFFKRVLNLSNNNNYFVYNQNDFRYKESEYFHDGSHLKINGAKIFTQEIIDFLKLEK